MRFLSKSLCLLICLSTAACVTPKEARYGVQDDQLAKVPARIAVLPCRLWPQDARYVGLDKTQIGDAEIQALCQQVDSYVLKGFEGQPYMRGLSPRVVKALLEKNPQEAQLSQLDQLWFQTGQTCEACKHPASYYREAIALRPDWRTWLSQLSRSAKNSDAVLMPMILQLKSQGLDDRGLAYAQRRAAIVLLLIDSNNGSLIWMGGREGETRRPLAHYQVSPALEAFAPWDELWGQLFVQDLWREFPGRQN